MNGPNKPVTAINPFRLPWGVAVKESKRIKIAAISSLLMALTFSLNAWSEDEHDHEHEKTEQHASHHEDDDHEAHDDHTDHVEGGHEHKEESQHDHEEGGHGLNEESEHGHEEENSSRIDDDMARKVGIVTSSASGKTLHQTVTTYGSLVTGPEQLSHVRARFEGLVKSVKVTIGDEVMAGDLLAQVESNESLKSYKIRSPISGTVVQRHANTGEVTRDQVLFSIANFASLWAELRIYPAQQASVKSGQSVHVLVNNETLEAKVNHVIPALDKPYLLARVQLNNSELRLSPGLLVEGGVEIGSFPVSLAVSKDAIQLLGGRQGVFVKHGGEYKFTPLVLGERDDHFVQVLDGLESGDEYVSQNSYLIKADIEKSEAEHEH